VSPFEPGEPSLDVLATALRCAPDAIPCGFALLATGAAAPPRELSHVLLNIATAAADEHNLCR
jgi:hypothetical protein